MNNYDKIKEILHDLTIKEILSNLSGNKIREIQLVSDETVSCDANYLKAYFKTKVVSIILDEEEKADFIRKLSEHGWYILYKDVHESSRIHQEERYFHVADIESINFKDLSSRKRGRTYHCLEINYKNTTADIIYIHLDDPVNDTQYVIDSLKKAGRFDLLLKIS